MSSDFMQMTPHSIQRTAQRAISHRMLSVLIENSSPRFHKGRLVYLGQDSTVETLKNKGIITSQEEKKYKGLAIICNTDGLLVTAYYPEGRKWKNLMRLPLYKFYYDLNGQKIYA